MLAAAAPPGDAAAGKLVYARCMACHSPDRHRTGPRHCELIGRVSGTAKGYDYSEAMRNAAILWDADALDRFLASPMTVVPGTTMGFAGVADARERRDLVAYLAELTASADECVEAQ
jgi:cytochrome c